MITRRTPYDEEQAFKQTPATLSRRILHLQKQAAKLGFQLRAYPESRLAYLLASRLSMRRHMQT